MISLIENGSAELPRLARALAPDTGRAHVVGLTGAPGVGKSTTTSALVGALRAEGQRVGVLAIDPSSPFSGGALLGDRVRMQGHALDDHVYIRSMATRGHLGGLAAAAPQALRVFDAAGFDTVLLETVGVGQSEIEVAATADTTLVLLAPGMGDGVQAAKAGILEIGDIFVVNKSDRPGADRTVTEITMMMSLVEEHSAWVPPIVKTVASTGGGIGELSEALETHHSFLVASGELDRRNRERVRIRIETQLKERFMERAVGGTISKEAYRLLLDDVLEKKQNPHDAAESILAKIDFGDER